ncbi:biotin-dependent carboxyltransferase family protein [Paenibacillus prosopidis]|uniref:Antagonist of KipI n=1 Tax=Paenibacillus prosopidis TaxID=630520 RepID=A0A368W793_9BACL|nr:biotin-dependent carboxyltransferase family protein [Paenibacillus prosopidis]RCW51870.1 antagonist of KipI [Paenibacillus prosopidis]
MSSYRIKVLRPGLLTTVQDLGRYGFQKYGVVAGGVMDTGAARTANWLVGNADREAVLEITLTGTELVIESEMVIAVCGGDMSVTIDGQAMPLWRPVLIRAGAVVKFSAYRSGCRSYLAAAGGFDVPEVMGSRSTYLRGSIGGFEGRAMKAGDVLAVKQPSLLSARIHAALSAGFEGGFSASNWHASHFAIAENLAEPIIRAIPGTHFDLFTPGSQEDLFNQTFRIGVQSDRMGCRLEGTQKLQLSSPAEMLSEAVANGTVQVPPDGNPIVLLADRQTTGGYPRIAQVATVDIPVFAQLKPGDRFRFEAVTQQEAERLYLDGERDMQLLKAAISYKFGARHT